MEVTVTREHINNGKPGEADACPITLALDECTQSGWKNISTGYIAVSYSVGQKFYRQDLPNKVQTFVERFDAGKPVEPFTFNLPERIHTTQP